MKGMQAEVHSYLSYKEIKDLRASEGAGFDQNHIHVVRAVAVVPVLNHGVVRKPRAILRCGATSVVLLQRKVRHRKDAPCRGLPEL